MRTIESGSARRTISNAAEAPPSVTESGEPASLGIMISMCGRGIGVGTGVGESVGRVVGP